MDFILLWLVIIFMIAYFFFVPVRLELAIALCIIPLSMLPLLDVAQIVLNKSKVAESIGLMSGARTQFAIHYANHGEWPESLKLPYKTAGKYTKSIHFHQGVLTAAFNDEALSHYQLSMALQVPDSSASILLSRCGYADAESNAAKQTTLPEQFLPFICR